MSTTIVVASALGFVAGYIGWFALFRLAGPMARMLCSEWSEELYVSRTATRLLSFLFLLALMLSVLQLFVEFIGPVGHGQSVRATLILASFVGFVCFGALPKIEARFRGVAQYTDNRDRE